MGRGGRTSSGRSSSGGRSFSSSSGRSFSSRSSSNSRGGRTSFNRSSSSSSRSSSSRKTVFYAPRTYYNTGGSYESSSRRRRSGGEVTGIGTAVSILVLITFILLITFSMLRGNSFGGEITKSTIKREELPSGSVNVTEYYSDELDWIGNKSKLEEGLKHFYKKTGIQPYLYITSEINGKASKPSEEEAQAFAEKIYSEKFTDEAHLLVIFQEYSPTNYYMCQLAGKQAKTLMDEEATNILYDYLEKYYYSDLSEEEYFSKAFSKAADDIMTVHRSPFVTIIMLVLVFSIVALAYTWWKNIKKHKEEEAKRLEEMLNKPLETFGDNEAEELSKKYENMNKGE